MPLKNKSGRREQIDKSEDLPQQNELGAFGGKVTQYADDFFHHADCSNNLALHQTIKIKTIHTMKSFLKIVFSLCILISSNSTFAQSFLNQVIVLNEGHYDYVTQQITKPVTVGYYIPQTNTYTTFDTIENARFATDVSVDDQFIYVSADAQLLKYDLNTHALILSQNIPGIRKIAVWHNKILVTRGEYGLSYNSYFQAYNKSDLSFEFELDTLSGPHYSTDGIIVKDDICYLAINNGFVWGNAVGIVGRVDLSSNNYLTEIPLGADGINPENIMLSGNKLYTLNNKDYTNASISSIDLSNTNVITTNLNNAGGCQGSALVSDHIAYQTYNENFIGRFDITSQNISDSLFINHTIYAMGSDTVNNHIYTSETDFTSYGLVLIYDNNGGLLNAFVAGVTPGKFAFDYRSMSSAGAINEQPSMLVYPNPATDMLTVASTNQNANSILTLTSMDGRIVFQSVFENKNFVEHIDLSKMCAGSYLLSLKSNDEISIQKIIKL